MTIRYLVRFEQFIRYVYILYTNIPKFRFVDAIFPNVYNTIRPLRTTRRLSGRHQSRIADIIIVKTSAFGRNVVNNIRSIIIYDYKLPTYPMQNAPRTAFGSPHHSGYRCTTRVSYIILLLGIAAIVLITI